MALQNLPFVQRMLASMLDAAENSRNRRNLAFFGRENKADEDRLVPQTDRDKVLARCHDLRRNNPVVSGAVDRIVNNVIGSKIRLQARTSSEEWNKEAEQWMADWSCAIDPSGRTSLTEACKLTCGAKLYDGENFHAPTKEGFVDMIEAERVRPSALVGDKAYQLDPRTGRVTSWRVHDRDVNGSFLGKHNEQWVSGVIHCRHRWRVDQIRGWPVLAVVANTASDLHEINVAQLKKNKMGALAAWVYKKGASGNGLKPRNTDLVNSAGQPLSRFNEGQIYEIEQGSDLTPFLNNQPGAEYAPFVELNLRLIGMALGLPYEFLLMYFGGSSFSSSKTALLQAYKTIEEWQEWIETDYIKPVTAWRIAKAIKDRELPPAPVDKRGVSEWAKWEWQRPGVEWIDPVGAIMGEMQEVRIGATTMYDVCAKRGKDAEEVLRQNARYLKAVERIAKEEGVSAQQLHSIQIPGQTPLTDKPVEDKSDKPEDSPEDKQEDNKEE